MENVADISHLNKIHTSMPFVGRLNSIWDKLTKSLGIFYRGSWTDDPKEPHVAFTQLFVDYKFMSKYSLLQTSIIVKSVGPGLAVVKPEIGFGCTVGILSFTPLGPFQQRHEILWYSHPATMLLGRMAIHGAVINLERDIFIWNYKSIAAKAIYVKEEREMKAFRRWYNQFYSENTPRIKFHVDTLSW
ncbi:unnamed protein product [Bemisia tabaci]|uniref:3-ketosteroid-9-alpha-monooxygenase oxygenase component-like C-terminal domain-containing protein n=1 Tax=Bemisia tabaci TaxID=7038 RepID=A0A9P0F450_BEMTA|nr:unnamed protein product [Bemisia tabaci]